VPGTPASIPEVIAAIEAAAPGAEVSFDDVAPLGVPEQGDASSFRALLGAYEPTPLREGVAETVERFRRALAEGLVEPEPATR
jgi:nucleoside-diphosphate-sugar epimerase